MTLVTATRIQDSLYKYYDYLLLITTNEVSLL